MLCKLLFYLHFRQLKASESIGSREKRLNRNRNELQLKQLQVSAHITAMTCLLEHVGNVTVIIHTIHFTTNASWKLSTLINEMLFYCILVPHAFLMNTSDNKYRILEHGWRNVIKNLLGARNKMMVISAEEKSDGQKSNGRDSVPPKSSISISVKHEGISNVTTFKSQISQDTTSKGAICTGPPNQSLDKAKPRDLDPSSLLNTAKNTIMSTGPSNQSLLNKDRSHSDPSSVSVAKKHRAICTFSSNKPLLATKSSHSYPSSLLDAPKHTILSTGQSHQAILITKPTLLDPSSLLDSKKCTTMCMGPFNQTLMAKIPSLLDPSSPLDSPKHTTKMNKIISRFRNKSLKKDNNVTHLEKGNNFCNENWLHKSFGETQNHAEASVSELEKLGRKHTISQKIIRGMVNSIEDEAMYLHYFRRLLVFISLCRSGSVLSEYELENKLQKPCHEEDDEIGDGKIEVFENIPGATHSPPSKYTNKELITFIRRHKLYGTQSEKIQLNGCLEYRTNARKQLLENLERAHDAHKDYEHSVEQLMNLEKGFIEDG